MSSTPTRRPMARASRNRVEVRDNPIASCDPTLGAALERAVGDALKDEGLGPVEVRFSLWRDGSPAVSFVCKVEAPGDAASGTPPWRWWSWLSRRPDQLREDLVRGLRARRQRLGYDGGDTGDLPRDREAPAPPSRGMAGIAQEQEEERPDPLRAFRKAADGGPLRP